MNKIQKLSIMWLHKNKDTKNIEDVYARIFEHARSNLIQRRFDITKDTKVHLSTYGKRVFNS
jgi:hypothetical protein